MRARRRPRGADAAARSPTTHSRSSAGVSAGVAGRAPGAGYATLWNSSADGPTPATSRALAVARGDEPADISSPAAAFRRRHPRMGRHLAGARRRGDRGLGRTRGARGDRCRRRRAHAGLRRRPHAPGVHQAVDRRVRLHRAPRRDDRRRRRPPRARQRAGGPGHPRADGGGGAAAVHLRVYASSCVPASPFESAGATLEATDIAELITRHGAARRGRGHELPRGDRRRRRDAGPGRGRRGAARGRPQPRRLGAAAGRLPRRRGRIRPREHPPGRGRGEAAQGDVGVPAPGVGEPEPGGRWPRRSSPTAPTRRRSAPTTASPTRCAGSATSTTAPGWRWPAGSPRSRRILLASTNPARYHGFDALGSLGPGHQADVLASPRSGPGGPTPCGSAAGPVVTGGALVPGAVPVAPVPDLLRDTVNIGALPDADALVLPAPLGTHVRAIGVESHSLTTLRTELEVEPDADLAHAAVVERHRATGRVGRGYVDGLRTAARRDRLHGRPRRPQSRRRRPVGRGHAQRGRPAGRDRRGPGGRARRRRPGRGAAPARRADERRVGGAGLRPRSRRSAAPPRSAWARRWPSRSCSCRSSRSR